MSDQLDQRAEARAWLERFLPRAMADGVLDDLEKQQLMAILTSGILTKDDVQTIFRDFLRGLYGELAADGQLTADELARFRSVVTQLRIPPSFLPPAIAALVKPA
jgi:hypothetical protein